MKRVLVAFGLTLALGCAASAQTPLTGPAAEVIYPTTNPDELSPGPNGTVRFKGPIAGSDSELRAVSGRACAFQSVALSSGRVIFQVNFADAEPDFTVKPSRIGSAAIRLVGKGIYCSKTQSGEPVCNDVYDVTVWGQRDMQIKISALRKLAEAGCPSR